MSKTIHILEDNDELRELYGYILADEDYNLLSFATMQAFHDHTEPLPDLYVLDVMLPDGDGLSLCKTLHDDPLTAHIPVIMVSAHKELTDISALCPHADFLAKPFDIQNLIDKVALKLH